MEPMPVERYKNSGLDYIKGKNHVVFKRSGIVITRAEFEAWAKDGSLLAQILKLEKSGKGGYDFEAARTRHVLQLLRLDGSSAPTEPRADDIELVAVQEPEPSPEPEPTQEPAPLPAPEPAPEPVTEEPAEQTVATDNAPEPVPVVEEQKRSVKDAVADLVRRMSFLRRLPNAASPEKPAAQRKHHNPHASPIVLIIVLTIVGLGSAVMSGYHIITYMIEGGRPDWIAKITGVIMTLFSAVAFSASRVFWEHRGVANKAISVAFSSFGVLVVAFAMFATMKVNYDQFKAGDDAKVKTIVENSTAVKSANAAEETLRGEVAGYDARIADARSDAKTWSKRLDVAQASLDAAPEDKNLAYARNVARNTLAAVNAKIEKLSAERKPYADKLLELQTGATQTEQTVVQKAHEDSIFGMFATVLGVDETNLKFVIYAIPAVFYDLMSPFALTVVMMLVEQKKRDEEEEDASTEA